MTDFYNPDVTGGPMIGPSTHSDVLTEPSDAWRNILAVITGDRAHIRVGALPHR